MKMTIIQKIGGRKFVTALVIVLAATGLAVAGVIDGPAWGTISMSVLAIYSTHNATSKK